MKKIVINSTLSLAVIASIFTGCGSSVQNVEKPDIRKPISDGESIIQLKRTNYFVGGGRKPDVIANDKLIGEIANGDELVWKTKANEFECISLDYGSDFLTGIKLDSTPLSYKCFLTKPKEVLSLNYDFMYPNMRAVRPIAFIPIFRDINKLETKPIAINSVTLSTKTESTINLVESLKEAMKKQFKDKLVSTSNKTVDLEILDYKTGSAALRWLASSHTASTFMKVKVTIKEDGVVTDTFITRPVISWGGFFTVGADEYILDEVAEDVYLHLFEPSKVTNTNEV